MELPPSTRSHASGGSRGKERRNTVHRTIVLTAALALLSAGVARPTTVRVPDDFSTVQAGVAGSSSGDTLLVAEGTYYGEVYVNKELTILGCSDATFTERDLWAHPSVLDATGDSCGFTFGHSGGDIPICLLDGFEVINAAHEGASATSPYVIDDQSSVSFRNLNIHDCGQGITYWGFGHGYNGFVEDCWLHHNEGWGLAMEGVPYYANIARRNLVAFNGRGVVILGDSDTDMIEVYHNTIKENDEEGIWINWDSGAPLSSLVIRDNIVTGNLAWGIYVWDSPPNPVFDYNCVSLNIPDQYYNCSPGPHAVGGSPMFCGGTELESRYTINGASNCAGAGTEGSDIGAFGVGCPSGPENVTASQSGASVVLDWDPPLWARVSVDHYVVRRDDGDGPVEIAEVPGAQTSYTDLSLPPCVSCEYTVFAIDSDMVLGAASDPVVTSLCYDGPTSLVASIGPDGQMLTWVAADGPVDHCVVMREHRDAPPESLASLPPSVSSFADTTTTPCPRDDYAYWIQPVYDTGWGGATSNIAGGDVAPASPAGLIAELIGDDVALTWMSNCEADLGTYRVYGDTLPLSPPPDSDYLIGYTGDTTFVDTGAGSRAVHFYCVTAVDDHQHQSGYSETAYTGHGMRRTVPSPYATIQSAIDAAAMLDTVLVSAGTYSERITLKEGVFVVGENEREPVTITAAQGPVVSALALSALPVFSGFVVDGQGAAQSGAELVWSNLSVEDCVFQHCSIGLSVRSGGAPALTSCRFTANSNGVAVTDSARPVITRSSIDANTFAGINNTGAPGPRVGGSLAEANDFMGNGYFQIFNMAPVTVDAVLNYWGSDCVGDSLFFGAVNYVPWTDALHAEVYDDCGSGMDGEGAGRLFLGHNFPNPFNPSTVIAYSIPSPGGPVSLCVYDVSGRKVRTLAEGRSGPGNFSVSWRGRDDAGRAVGSGVYFYKLQLGEEVIERKMVLLK
jgi:hypothetical protein